MDLGNPGIEGLDLGESAEIEWVLPVPVLRVVAHARAQELRPLQVFEHGRHFRRARIEDSQRRQVVRSELHAVGPAPVTVLAGQEFLDLAEAVEQGRLGRSPGAVLEPENGRSGLGPVVGSKQVGLVPAGIFRQAGSRGMPQSARTRLAEARPAQYWASLKNRKAYRFQSALTPGGIRPYSGTFWPRASRAFGSGSLPGDPLANPGNIRSDLLHPGAILRAIDVLGQGPEMFTRADQRVTGGEVTCSDDNA